LRCCAKLTEFRLLLFALLAGCAPLAPLPAGTLAFGLLGDTPYTEAEVARLDILIDEMNAQELAFVVHVGDIGGSRESCSDDWLVQRKRQFERLRHPFILLPGDNEWTDCRAPLERLERWRGLFCNTSMKIERQPGPHCEHLRWEAGGWVFVALNVPGHNNNVRHAEHAPRMQAVLAWLDEAARLAQQREGLVVLMQANPFLILPRDGFRALRARLESLAAERAGRIVLVHGDTHLQREDEPLPGLRRVEVWGSPVVSWLRASVPPFRVDAVR
jgi:hypothetical protein